MASFTADPVSKIQMDLLPLTSADALQGLVARVRAIPPDFKTSFSSVGAVADKLCASSHEDVLVASNASGDRGFLVRDSQHRVHTMFTLPCTPDEKIPSLFREMLIRTSAHGAALVFLTEEGYNEKMIRFFKGSAEHAGVACQVVN